MDLLLVSRKINAEFWCLFHFTSWFCCYPLCHLHYPYANFLCFSASPAGSNSKLASKRRYVGCVFIQRLECMQWNKWEACPFLLCSRLAYFLALVWPRTNVLRLNLAYKLLIRHFTIIFNLKKHKRKSIRKLGSVCVPSTSQPAMQCDSPASLQNKMLCSSAIIF